MFNFGAAQAVDFLPDEDAQQWVREGLQDHARRLGDPAAVPRVFIDVPDSKPGDLDSLFDVVCGVQSEVGQGDVEFTLLELGPETPKVPERYIPLGNPEGQLMHTFVTKTDEYLMVVVPAIFKLQELVMASIARELGRIGIHRTGGHQVDADEFEGDAEIAAVALGMGVWVANGAYIYENACCGGGCGIDLTSLRAGLSLPEACFALALDGHRKGLSRRVVTKHLDPTQRAALKRSWSYVGKQPELLAIAEARAPALEG